MSTFAWSWLRRLLHRHRWWPELYGSSCKCGLRIVMHGYERYL